MKMFLRFQHEMKILPTYKSLFFLRKSKLDPNVLYPNILHSNVLYPSNIQFNF